MRVFVTGASGWIGSALLPELIDAGHHVVGLARSDEAASRLRAGGAAVLRGEIDDLDVLRAGAEDSDGVVHLAFKHDVAFSPGGFATAATSERRAIDVMGEALAGSDRPLVIASGTPALPGKVATENDEAGAVGPPSLRGANAAAALALAAAGVRSSVVRLPRSVHGEGDHGFIAALIGIAREKGVSGYVGDGSSRWPAVHVLDAARLFRLALESAPPGTVLHAVADEAVPTGEISEVIGRQLGLATVSAPRDDFGFLGQVLAVDQPASSALTRARFGWRPEQPGLIADMEAGHYFAVRANARQRQPEQIRQGR